MELEKEISKNNQQNSQKNSEKEIAEDLNLKNYLDSKFEDEFKEIENEINDDKNTLNSNDSKLEESLDESTAQEEKVIEKTDFLDSGNINLNQINPFFTKDQFTFKATPAQDFLASMQNKPLEENIEKTAENYSENIIQKSAENSTNSIENIVENEVFEKSVEDLNINTSDQDFIASMQNKPLEENIKKTAENYSENIIQKSTEASTNSIENIVENEVFEKPVEDLNTTTPAQDFLASMQNKPLEENIKKTAENYSENIIQKTFETSAASLKNIAENEVFEKPVENLNKITQQNNNQLLKSEIINQEITMVESTKFTEFNNSKDSKLKTENYDQKNPILEKINYNLIREEAVYQASNSMKKLMEAKNLVSNVGNFARDETLTKIAVSLMEPKLEKWLNDNLPSLVENIVREEIEKIVPKS
jgi:cell pole-organizing protein PopZ